MGRVEKLKQLAMTLRQNDIKEKIADAHVKGVRIFKPFSELELMNGINAIEESVKRYDQISKKTPIGKVGIIAPYNTPGFALGYGCELIVGGNDIEIYFSNDLIEYRKVIDDIVHSVGLENHIKVFMGSQREFGEYVISSLDGLQIYGGDSPFVFNYAKEILTACIENKKEFIYCFEGPGNDPAIVLQSAKNLNIDSVPLTLESLKNYLGIDQKYEFKHSDFFIQYVSLNAVAGTIVGRGQSCMAFRRIIIHEDFYGHIKEEIICIVEYLNTFPVSDENQTNIIGPIGSVSTNKKLFARTLGFKHDGEEIPGQIDSALNLGAEIHLPDGSTTKNKRQYIEQCIDLKNGVMRPFVVSNVDPESKLNTEETFLPVISLVKADSDFAALDYATRGHYCLRTSLYSDKNDKNFKHIIKILSQHFGIVDENQPFFTAWNVAAEWGPGKYNNRSGFVKVYGKNGSCVEVLGPRKMYEVFSKEYVTSKLL
jgi:acyl-CoA reductase-like NAD-dependent aldehyde dehydrogenase